MKTETTNRASITRLWCVKQTPANVSGYWDTLRQAVSESNPHMPKEFVSSIMAQIRAGNVVAWALHDATDPDVTMPLVGFLLTSLAQDQDGKLVYVHTLWKFPDAPVSMEAWQSAMDTIEKYARENGCAYVKTAVREQHVVALTQSLGFDEELRIVRKAV